MALKLIDASEVITSGTKKGATKKTVKSNIKTDDKSGDKKIIDLDDKGDNKRGYKKITYLDDKSDDKSEGEQPNIVIGTIRTIKLVQSAYYGPNDDNKKKFVKMYKKLGLVWKTEYINGGLSDGWFNKDKSQYIIKLPEEGEFKRFKFYGCDDIYDYFVTLGAVAFDYKENLIAANKITVDNTSANTTVGGKIENCAEEYEFIGADLWSGYRTRQLLKNMPDNWGVIWK